MLEPKISIVVPAYNAGTTIEDLLLSVLDQDYHNWEMIIQNGNSSDKTVEIIESFSDDRIKIYSEDDEGMYDALNKAIDKTVGDYILHLNCDEQLMKGGLSKIVKETKDNPGYNVYCFGVIIVNENREPKVFRTAYPQRSLFIKLFNLDILTAGIVYKHEVFDSISFNTEFKAVSDALLFIDLLNNFKIFYSELYSSIFLIEGNNLSLAKDAIEERKNIRQSVIMSSFLYIILYYFRKIYKLLYNCHVYTGPKDSIRIFEKGDKNYKDTLGLSSKLNWVSF